ncbi:MAG TPA: ankyrin repeat domain-containing protein [Bdellovibrionota bacterium]|jgi:ankyrin repeat protein
MEATKEDPLRLHPLFLSLFLSLPALAEGLSLDDHTLTVDPPDPRPKAKPQKPIPCTRYDLHGAVQFRSLDCLKVALTHMDVNDRDVNGDTPLHNAIHFKNGPAIRFLLKNGADLHLNDFEGRNAIRLAQDLGYPRMQEFFLALERETERLLEAIDNNDVVAVSNSLLRGASLGMRDSRLDTPLHRAAQSNLPEVGKLLVHHGAKLEARNYLGETPLLTAALRDHYDFLRMLVEAGANVNAIDERRRTVYDLAELQSDPRVLKLLQEKKARRGSSASVEFDFSEVAGEMGGAAQP